MIFKNIPQILMEKPAVCNGRFLFLMTLFKSKRDGHFILFLLFSFINRKAGKLFPASSNMLLAYYSTVSPVLK